MAIATETDRLLTRADAANFLGLKPQTLAKWAMTGEHLPYVKVGRMARYRLSDLQEYLNRRTIGSLPESYKP